ncbi:MAG: alcohol dehydrogenase catalytic domain-containing protein, partial [Acidimicrobiales bacterium]
MRAVVVDNGELRFEDRPDPVPGDTEVLVATQAAGLNGADMLQRRGHYPAPPGAPADIPGMELAGEVVEVGGQVKAARRGDRVMAIVGGGAQATMAVVDESHLLPVPDSVSWPEAGGFPEVFTTAYDALFTRAGLSVGDRLLVTGAAGGVGVAAVQLAAAAGATVV